MSHERQGMSKEAQELIESAKTTNESIMVLIEGDWYNTRWTTDVYDGSPYGTTGFANEDMMCMDESMFEDARPAEDDEDTGILTPMEIREEREMHEAERLEAERLDALAERRAARKARRLEVEDRYQQVTGLSDCKDLTITEMKQAIKEKHAEQSAETLQKLLNGFLR